MRGFKKGCHSWFYTGDFGLYSWVLRGGDFTQYFCPGVRELHWLSHSHWVNIPAMPGIGEGDSNDWCISLTPNTNALTNPKFNNLRQCLTFFWAVAFKIHIYLFCLFVGMYACFCLLICHGRNIFSFYCIQILKQFSCINSSDSHKDLLSSVRLGW